MDIQNLLLSSSQLFGLQTLYLKRKKYSTVKMSSNKLPIIIIRFLPGIFYTSIQDIYLLCDMIHTHFLSLSIYMCVSIIYLLIIYRHDLSLSIYSCVSSTIFQLFFTLSLIFHCIQVMIFN